MVPPIENFIEQPARTRVRVGLAPAQNAVHSLLLLTKTKELSGLGDWVTNTAYQLSPEDREKHQRVMIGFYHAITPERRWSSFPVYLQHLETMKPETLRKKMIKFYLWLGEEKVTVEETLDKILASEDDYLSFLRERFDEKFIDEDLERWAYSYIIKPDEMQRLIVSHLKEFWDKYLAAEWEKNLPTLKKAVDAFKEVDFSKMSDDEAIAYITGRPAEEVCSLEKHKEFDTLYFAPSLHVGPYIGKFHEENLFGFLFGARLPDHSSIRAPELSQAEIYVRLNALADETRLQILQHIRKNGESCSTEIIEMLGLSQSATSRHLSQLTAAGYLSSRRLDGSKCYTLNEERISNTLNTIKAFLLG